MQKQINRITNTHSTQKKGKSAVAVGKERGHGQIREGHDMERPWTQSWTLWKELSHKVVQWYAN